MIEIGEGDFSVDDVISGIHVGSMGCVITFIGTVRDNSKGRDVDRIEIQVYEEMALKQLRVIADEAIARFGVEDISIVHRYGTLRVGEKIMMIAVGAGHRAEGFEACRYVIDSIKERVPIWKKEFTPEGEHWMEGELR